MAMIDPVRYARQMMMPEIGQGGQEHLSTRAALVVGAGGLGSPILQYLVASGVGRIGIVDQDCLELSNLNRQVLYNHQDLGQEKARLAKQKLAGLNEHCQITAYPYRLTEANALATASTYDIIIDASDNLETRYLLDDTAQKLGIPYLYGAVEGFVGQTSLFHYEGAGSYRSLFPSYDATTDSLAVGVIGATAGVLGSLMAMETIKVLLGLPSSLAGQLLHFDLKNMHFTHLQLN